MGDFWIGYLLATLVAVVVSFFSQRRWKRLLGQVQADLIETKGCLLKQRDLLDRAQLSLKDLLSIIDRLKAKEKGAAR